MDRVQITEIIPLQALVIQDAGQDSKDERLLVDVREKVTALYEAAVTWSSTSNVKPRKITIRRWPIGGGESPSKLTTLLDCRDALVICGRNPALHRLRKKISDELLATNKWRAELFAEDQKQGLRCCEDLVSLGKLSKDPGAFTTKASELLAADTCGKSLRRLKLKTFYVLEQRTHSLLSILLALKWACDAGSIAENPKDLVAQLLEPRGLMGVNPEPAMLARFRDKVSVFPTLRELNEREEEFAASASRRADDECRKRSTKLQLAIEELSCEALRTALLEEKTVQDQLTSLSDSMSPREQLLDENSL